jgi:transposase
MRLPRFISYANYEVEDFKEFLTQGRIEVHLRHKDDAKFECHRCGGQLSSRRGHYYVRVEEMPIMGYRCFLVFKRLKGHCQSCKKARAERVDFISAETPHLTQDFAWWVGRICEIAAVSRVAELTHQNETTTWRLDLHRMQRMLSHYKIPRVKKISVDEVYARKKPRSLDESRDERFFTVISDLETRRVIWVSESRSKKALDQFFILIGKEACEQIEVVAVDQHADYAASVREYCKRATLVWDRFHIMQNFELAINDQRLVLHGELGRGSELQRLTRGKFKYLFLKKASRRTAEERMHMDEVVKHNEQFFKLELIKERMLSFFNQGSEDEAKAVFEEVGDWIWQSGFEQLKRWYNNLESGWETLRNYFKYRVTSALSEGHNNVIKMLKRRAFGYRNMMYFRLKIMQVCGYLNSRYIQSANQLLTQN